MKNDNLHNGLIRQRKFSNKYCPRGCNSRLLLDNNAVSKVDGKQICAECYTAETIGAFLAARRS